MQNKTRRKLPKTTIEDLTQTCEAMSKYSGGEPAKEIFKRYLNLIDKYAYYFFSEPWPLKYDFTQATTFTEQDLHFLLGTEKEPADESEVLDRFDIICLKKTVSFEGSPANWGLFWTQQALHKKLDTILNNFQTSDEDKQVVNEN